MGFFDRLFRTAGGYRTKVTEAVRAAGDHRRLEWDDGEGHVLTLMRHAVNGDSVDLTEAFEQWKASGDFAPTQQALAEVLTAGATTGPTRTAIVTAAELDEGEGIITPGLRLVLMEISPDGETTYLDAELLAARGLTRETFLNSAEQFADDEAFELLVDGVALYSVNEPSGLFVSTLARRQLPPLAGDPVLVFTLPGQTLLFGSRDEAATTAAARHLQALLAEPDAGLIGLCYRWKDGALSPWLPPRTLGPERVIFAAYRRAGLELAYARQKKQLKGATDFFVATFMVERQKGLPLISTASWATGVVALLPRTDALIISRSLSDQRVVPFAVALERFPELIRPLPSVWPPRYAVTDVPSAEALDALGELRPDLSSVFDVTDEGELTVPPPHVLPEAVFAKECIAQLEHLGLTGIEYFEEGFGVRFPIAPPPGVTLAPGARPMMQLGFRTPYGRYAHLPDAERSAALRAWFTELRQNLSRAHQTVSRESVMPLLQHAGVCWRGPLQNELQAPKGMTVSQPTLLHRELCPGVVISFVADSPTTVQFLSVELATAVAGSAESAFELAMDNLRRSTTAPLEVVRPGLYASPIGDEYDATRLLLGDRLVSLTLKGDPVAFVPNRTTLLITGSDDDANLLECFARVRVALKSDARPVTRTPLRLTADGWRPWVPAEGRDARPALASLAREAMEEELRQSAELLQARFPTLALSAMGLRDSAGTPEVLATFDPAQPALLPRADQVSTKNGADLIPWAHFEAQHRTRLEPVAEANGTWFRFTP